MSPHLRILPTLPPASVLGLVLLPCLFVVGALHAQSAAAGPVAFAQNRPPLKPRAYLELPLGSIRPTGWLEDQLHRMRDGMTGNLDSIYPAVMGERNGWLGGDGDGWERGPYWIDGLLPLAYQLDDEALEAKAQAWVEWTLTHQREDGYLGPLPFAEPPPYEPGLQKDQRRDWWPKMVMLKVLQQYYQATGDERVVDVLTAYFRFELAELPETPLDTWTFWANRRGGDNLQVVYWLYNITGDDFLLELAELIHAQTFPWTDVFLNEQQYGGPSSPWSSMSFGRYPYDSAQISTVNVADPGSLHCVNFAQGLKEPVVYYQQAGDERHLRASERALRDVKHYHGQPQGMYGGDEPLHGTDPVRGVEFCSVSEEMFSLETMLGITGDMAWADQLERIAYNALPTQASDDFSERQYFQAANQVELSRNVQASYETRNHRGSDFVFGVFTGYVCCTSNMHQSWPKYVQNLWYATPDSGVAALLYAPSEVTLPVAGGATLTVTEETGYPFRESVRFTLALDASATFPFHLRIPEWADSARVTINGEAWAGEIQDQTAILDRAWSDGDVVELGLPMRLRSGRWHDFAVAIERGPLVYALRIEGRDEVKTDSSYGEYREVYPTSTWNYALLQNQVDSLTDNVEVVEHEWDTDTYPWNLEDAPIELRMRGAVLPEWKLTNGTPYFPAWWGGREKATTQVDDITLVPYGCTTLRITEFPVCGLY